MNENLGVSLNDTQGLSAYFPAAVADLIPSSFVKFNRAITKLASQGNDLRNDKLSNTTGITEGGIEDGDAMFGGILRVHLVCAYAEASNDDQVFGFAKDSGCKLGLGAYTNDLKVSVTIRMKFEQETHALPHRIFVINSSSGNADFRWVT